MIGGLTDVGAGASLGAFASLALEKASANQLSPSIQLLGTQGKTFMILAVTWVIFPILNAAQDFLSYGVSHKLAGYASKIGTDPPKLALLATADLAIALLLAALTFVSVASGLWLASQAFHFDFSPNKFVETFWAALSAQGI